MLRLSADAKLKLQAVRDHIAAEPRRLNMGTWLERWDNPGKNTILALPPCGTVGCIAGWLILLNNKEEEALPMGFPGFARTGAQLLGLNAEEVKEIFFVDSWPEPYRNEYLCVDYGNVPNRRIAKAEIALRYLDALIAGE
jgi:hypothetical protein